MSFQITTKWKTVCTVGFTSSVASGGRENRRAHGGVTHCQVRRNEKGEILGRKVNSTGPGKQRNEVGKPFLIDDETFTKWMSHRI